MKDLKISRELLSEVLKLEVVKHSLFNKRNNTFNITYMQSEDSLKANWMPVNVYEFVFKCKDWACNKGFILISYKKPYDSVKKKGYCQTHHIHDKTREKDKPFVCDFEYGAIIKACEWIIKERI